jgi:hypothetical protein
MNAHARSRTQARLQKKIVERQRMFGMLPILPAFAGFVPDSTILSLPRFIDVALTNALAVVSLRVQASSGSIPTRA